MDRIRIVLTSDNAKLNSPLHYAATLNQSSILEYYLQTTNRNNINLAEPSFGYTPLHCCISQHNESLAINLINLGADIACLTSQNQTCLHLACQSASLILVVYLIALGQDVNAIDDAGVTPLMLACTNSFSYDIIRILIKMGSQVNVVDNIDRSTALHYALQADNSPAINYIVKYSNINLNYVNDNGDKLIDIATQAEDLNVLRNALKPKLPEHISKMAFIFLRILPWLYIGLMGLLPSLCPSFILTLFSGLLITGICSFLLYKTILITYPRHPLFPSIILAYFFYLNLSNFTHALPHDISPLPIKIIYLLSFLNICYCIYKILIADPGYINRTHEEKMNGIIRHCQAETFNIGDFCSSCVQIRPLRSKHCRTCDKCVAKFDHHCPWIDNCLGVENHRLFWIFLLNGLFTLTIIIYEGFAFFYQICGENYRKASFIFPRFWLAYDCSPWSTWMGCLLVPFYMWMLFMFVLHTYIVIVRGMTTNEMFNDEKYSHSRKNYLAEVKFYRKGILQNLSDFLGVKLFEYNLEIFNYQIRNAIYPRKIDWYNIENLPQDI